MSFLLLANISPNVVINLIIIAVSVSVILIFAVKGAHNFTRVRQQIHDDNVVYREIILGVESVSQHISNPHSLSPEIRVAIWELYGQLHVQPNKESKSITLHRKLLEKRKNLLAHLEKGKVNLEILPFLGIIGTLLGFAIPYALNVSGDSVKQTFNVTGIGFFLAATSTICALIALILLKKIYESDTLAEYDYYIQQQLSLEKIMIEYDGFTYLEMWLGKIDQEVSKNVSIKESPVKQTPPEPKYEVKIVENMGNISETEELKMPIAKDKTKKSLKKDSLSATSEIHLG